MLQRRRDEIVKITLIVISTKTQNFDNSKSLFFEQIVEQLEFVRLIVELGS
jgi:hypothetical protein